MHGPLLSNVTRHCADVQPPGALLHRALHTDFILLPKCLELSPVKSTCTVVYRPNYHRKRSPLALTRYIVTPSGPRLILQRDNSSRHSRFATMSPLPPSSQMTRIQWEKERERKKEPALASPFAGTELRRNTRHCGIPRLVDIAFIVRCSQSVEFLTIYNTILFCFWWLSNFRQLTRGTHVRPNPLVPNDAHYAM